MSDALLRQWCMLRGIPRPPKRIDAKSLLKRLEASGFQVNLRTVQRDLVNLSRALPLSSDDSKPQGWSWRADAPQLDIPTLEPLTALVFHLAEKHLHALLPAASLGQLSPWFDTAKRVLDQQDGGLGAWRNKVRVLAAGQALMPPLVDEAIQERVSQALLTNKQLRIEYAPRTGSQVKNYVINLLGLVVRNQIIYLVATIGSYTDIRQLALHRIATAELQETDIVPLAGFDLEAYIQEGAFGWQVSEGGPIRLVATFSQGAAPSVTERLLAPDQEIDEHPNGSVTITATVADTKALRVWLLGFGDQVIVEGPSELRNEIAQIVKAMCRNYDV